MIPGFILRKTGVTDSNFAKALSVLTLYVAQIALIIHSYLIEFNSTIFKGVVHVFIYSFVIHLILYFLAKQFFKKHPKNQSVFYSSV
jgi:predicted permease